MKKKTNSSEGAIEYRCASCGERVYARDHGVCPKCGDDKMINASDCSFVGIGGRQPDIDSYDGYGYDDLNGYLADHDD